MIRPRSNNVLALGCSRSGRTPIKLKVGGLGSNGRINRGTKLKCTIDGQCTFCPPASWLALENEGGIDVLLPLPRSTNFS